VSLWEVSHEKQKTIHVVFYQHVVFVSEILNLPSWSGDP